LANPYVITAPPYPSTAGTIKEMLMPRSPATTVLDSLLFRDAFGTERMRAVFSDLALVARCTEVEVALAKAEARCGVIPAQAADDIARRSSPRSITISCAGRPTSRRTNDVK
jgi:3-carboxy-cis,cis-muconate cycloisomerase